MKKKLKKPEKNLQGKAVDHVLNFVGAVCFITLLSHDALPENTAVCFRPYTPYMVGVAAAWLTSTITNNFDK